MRNRILLFTLIIPFAVFAQRKWTEIYSVEDLYRTYPENVQKVFTEIDLNYRGLEKVKQAYEKKDVISASNLLLEYYNSQYSGRARRKVWTDNSNKTNSLADSITRDIFTFQQVTGKVPRKIDEHLVWSFTGPQDDIEWAWALNRHYPVSTLLPLYFETGNPKYVKYIDQFIKDWILESTPYPAKKSSTAMWRGLEVSFRVKVWSKVFYDLMDSKYISPATRLLILSSLPDHAHYARNFHGQTNWLTMEMSGLATFATSWPEFKSSKDNLDYSISAITQSLKEQVYPDGVQTELTSSYHRVALANFSLFKEICEENKIKLPEFFTKQIENMWSYLAYSIRPNGYGVLNNDGDLDYNRERLLTEANKYGREDWKYLASNGQIGKKPNPLPSIVFPWAGQAIFRSGYDSKAHWSFFDIGPWGSGHQHNDKLHLSVSAFGKDFLVDAGRFAYRGEIAEKFRKYATGSKGHNVMLIDGKEQKPGPLLAEKPLSESDYSINKNESYAHGFFDKFDGLEGECKHDRTLYYKKDNFWIVVDKITTDRPREIQALWHWHPDCKLINQGDRILAENSSGNLSIVPVSENDWKIDLIKGQEYPEIQGWYSKEYNIYEPSTISVYSTRIESNSIFVWLLFPSEKTETNVKAEIISSTPEEIKVRVFKDKKEWTSTIPLS